MEGNDKQIEAGKVPGVTGGGEGQTPNAPFGTLGSELPSLEDVRRERRVGKRTETALMNALNTWEANKRPDWWTRWLAIIAIVASASQFLWAEVKQRHEVAASERPIYAACFNLAAMASALHPQTDMLDQPIEADAATKQHGELLLGYLRQLDIQDPADAYLSNPAIQRDLENRIESRQLPKFGAWFSLIFDLHECVVLSSQLGDLYESLDHPAGEQSSLETSRNSIEIKLNELKQVVDSIERDCNDSQSLDQQLPKLLVVSDSPKSKSEADDAYRRCQENLAALYSCFVRQHWEDARYSVP